MFLYKMNRKKIDNHGFEYYSYFCKLELKDSIFIHNRPEDTNNGHLLLYKNNDALLQGNSEVMTGGVAEGLSFPGSLWGRLLEAQPN